MSVKRDTNADQFVAEFERRRVEFKIIVSSGTEYLIIKVVVKNDRKFMGITEQK